MKTKIEKKETAKGMPFTLHIGDGVKLPYRTKEDAELAVKRIKEGIIARSLKGITEDQAQKETVELLESVAKLSQTVPADGSGVKGMLLFVDLEGEKVSTEEGHEGHKHMMAKSSGIIRHNISEPEMVTVLHGMLESALSREAFKVLAMMLMMGDSKK